MSSTVEQREIEHFAKDSDRWWDEDGPFAPLHRMNPVRMRYLKEQIGGHFECDQNNLKPFAGLKILDAGCGGGLICEPLARLGAKVTGLDADGQAIEVAREHANMSGLEIQYVCETADAHIGTHDVVLALEIIEHVADVDAFVNALVKLVRPGGLVIFSTLNRTPKSFALGVIAAEYILRWVPRGTHNWKKFMRPSELARKARTAGLKEKDLRGIIFDPVAGDFDLSKTDIDVNYFMAFER